MCYSPRFAAVYLGVSSFIVFVSRDVKFHVISSVVFFRSPSSGKPIVHPGFTSLHFAPPLLYAKPVTCNRYQTSTCFYYFTSSFTSSFRYTHRHTHTAFRRIVNTILLFVKQVNNPFQMACLSDLFLLVAEIWQEACSVPMLQDRYKAYMGGGGWQGTPSEGGRLLKGIYISTLTKIRNLNALVC